MLRLLQLPGLAGCQHAAGATASLTSARSAFGTVVANCKADTSVRAVTALGKLGGAGTAADRKQRKAENVGKLEMASEKEKNRRIWAWIFFFSRSQMSMCAGSLAF